MAGHEVYCVAAEGAERPLGEILEELLEEAIKAEGYEDKGGLSGRRCTWRLSKDDDGAAESASITTQRQMLRSYCGGARIRRI